MWRRPILAPTPAMGWNRTMADLANSLLRTHDHVWNRLMTRLVGLGDAEYLWEPVSGCWSLRRGSDGHWRLDDGGGGGPAPDPVPVTTIAWRLGHIVVCLGGFTSFRFGDGTLTPETIDFPASALEVTDFLDGYYRTWRAALGELDQAGWEAPLGQAWGEYAEDNTLDLALHVLDEVIHHAAEVGVLRDLYSHGSSYAPSA